MADDMTDSPCDPECVNGICLQSLKSTKPGLMEAFCRCNDGWVGKACDEVLTSVSDALDDSAEDNSDDSSGFTLCNVDFSKLNFLGFWPYILGVILLLLAVNLLCCYLKRPREVSPSKKNRRSASDV